jgi:colanic acid/amylovoran biosynthesis protein
MKIQIDGGARINKGAELMLFAVLKEIERVHPMAEVILNNESSDIESVRKYVNLKITQSYSNTTRLIIRKFRLISLARLISSKLAFKFTLRNASKDVDVVFNIGGFQFGDQWRHDDFNLQMWDNYLRRLKSKRTKIIFLPQALGPFKKQSSKKMLHLLNKYADLIYAREDVSYNHMVSEGYSVSKLRLFPDFTALLDGISPFNTTFYTGEVCFIPNLQMVKQNIISKEKYILFMTKLIDLTYKKGLTPFLLNHEGVGDHNICKEINNDLTTPIKYISGLNALEVKGVIANSFLVVSSRYHGVASALSSGVPCLATSWSHKYELLFNDFGQEDCVLDISKIEKSLEKAETFLSANKNNAVRVHLSQTKKQMQEKNRLMWNEIWGVLEKIEVE